MFAQFRKKKSMVGIDISATAIKMLELSFSDNQYRVESYAVTPLPSGAVIEKNIKDQAAVIEGIKRTIERAGTRTKNAALAVSDSSVITKVISVDASLNDEDMEENVAIEADKFIPYPLDEVRLDFDVIGESAKNPQMLDVLLVASRSENVTVRAEVAQQAGLDVKVVDIESYAMERACHLLLADLPNQGREQTIAIFDVGATMTNLTILHDLSTVFTREELFGGQQLTQEIQQRYDLTFEDAGRAKKTGSLPDDYETEVLIPFKESAVLQIRRALQFFFSASKHSTIEHILLAGGAVQISGLPEMITEQVGIPTSMVNPFANMAVNDSIDIRWLNNDAPALMICCGLAMRGIN